MLSTIRRHSKSFVVYLVFAALVIVFALNFGPGSGACTNTPTSYAALVNGETIRQRDYSLLLDSRVQQLRRSTSVDITPEFIERMGLRKQIIDQLIERKLLAKEARGRGLVVTDDELLEHLKTRYGVDQFDDYSDWVGRTFQISVRMFEDDVREEILALKLSRLITETITVSTKEVQADYQREHDRLKADFVRFNPADFAAKEPTAADIVDLVKTEAAAISAKYEEDKFRYRTPESRRLRQILRKLPRDATPEEETQARELLSGLRQKIMDGADFAALAKEQSEDDTPVKDAGGDMGWVSRGALVKVLADAVFGLQEGQFTEPIRTPQGLHLVQLQQTQPPATKSLEEAQTDVAKSLLHERDSKAQARAAATAFLEQLRDGKKLEELTAVEGAEDKTKPERLESPWILRTQATLPRLGTSAELHTALFTRTLADAIVPEAHEVGGYLVVAVLKERELPDMEKFASEEKSLREQAEYGKRNQVLREWLQHLRSKATVELNPTLFPANQDGEA